MLHGRRVAGSSQGRLRDQPSSCGDRGETGRAECASIKGKAVAGHVLASRSLRKPAVGRRKADRLASWPKSLKRRLSSNIELLPQSELLDRPTDQSAENECDGGCDDCARIVLRLQPSTPVERHSMFVIQLESAYAAFCNLPARRRPGMAQH